MGEFISKYGNPWTAEAWNVTTQGAFLKQYGVNRARDFAKQAGTVLGGGQPRAMGPTAGAPTYILSKKVEKETTVGGNADIGVADVSALVSAIDADHTAALVRAIATGKPIMFRGGVTYSISAKKNLPSGTTVFSMGGRATINTVGTAGLFVISGVSDVVISGLDVDGGGHADASPIDFQGATDCVLEDCSFSNSRTIKIFSGSTGVQVRNCSVINSSLHGVQIDGPTTHSNTVTRCEFENSVGFGVCLTNGSFKNEVSFCRTLDNGIELVGVTYLCWGNRVIGNHAEGTGDNGISITGFDNVVVGNTCIACFHNGIGIYGSNNVVTGNSCRNNAQRFLIDGSSWAGIHIDPGFGGAGYQNVVSGNSCVDDQATPTQAWGTRIGKQDYAQWTAGQSATSAATYCFNGTNAYVAASTGTAGSTAPTHTSGTASDGGVSWTYLFGLLTTVPGNPFMGGADNALTGNVCYGNRLAQAIDSSGNSNSDVGGNHSKLRTVGNTTPMAVLGGLGGDMILRGGSNSAWTMAYACFAGTTSSLNSWAPLQPRMAGASTARATRLTAGFEGAQYWDTTQIRPIFNGGVANNGAWLDGLGRQDPVVGLTSAGTTQGNALALAFAHAVVATVGAGSGATLPAITFSGMTMDVWNDDASNDLLVYPASGSSINKLAANAPITIAPGAGLRFTSVSATSWRAR